MTITADFVTGQTVSFQQMRALMGEVAIQEGVVGATDLRIVQRGAGANMSVDAGVGACWVNVDVGARNGLSHVYSDAVENIVIAASNATNPRIDQVVLRYNDATIPTGTGNLPTLEALAGTATTGATLDNRTGAATLPAASTRLADILVPAASTSVVTANIRDRRPWARGARFRNLGDSAGVTGTVSYVQLGAAQRIECSGANMTVLADIAGLSGTGAQNFQVQLRLDGVSQGAKQFWLGTNGTFTTTTQMWDITPSAGSYLFTIWANMGSAMGSMAATATGFEWPGQIAANNGTA